MKQSANTPIAPPISSFSSDSSTMASPATPITILYQDADFIICIKPVGALSEENVSNKNTVPALLRVALGDETAPLFTVHRLDKMVGGVMVYARTQFAAAALSKQIQAHSFTKEYRAIAEGTVSPAEGRWEDLLYHDKRKNKVFCVKKERKGVKAAALRYQTLATLPFAMEQVNPETGAANKPQSSGKAVSGAVASGVSTSGAVASPLLSLLAITLETGRTHQIRVQSASRKHPLVGDARYGAALRGHPIALFSHRLSFAHPRTGKLLTFTALPAMDGVWAAFSEFLTE